MFRVAGKVLDVYDDLKLKLLQDNLEKVGKLTMAPADEVAALPDDSFALVFMTKTGRSVRKYPVHNRDATLISSLYFEKMAHKLPPEARGVAATFLKKAHEGHGLSSTNLLEKFASEDLPSNMVDTAKCSPIKQNATKSYALGAEYPIDSSDQLKTACAYFDENWKLFDPKDRAEFAHNVMAKCAELKVSVGDESFIHKYAGEDFGNMIDSAYHERSNLLFEDEMAKRTLTHLFEKKASFGVEKFADELAKFDVTNRLNKHWDRGHLGVRDPYRSTFESVKIASKIKVGNEAVDPASIVKVSKSETLKNTFDDDFCQKFAEAPVEIFQSLPRPEQQVIISLIGSE